MVIHDHIDSVFIPIIVTLLGPEGVTVCNHRLGEVVGILADSIVLLR
jgi:hypothetical protein